jgi:hypothetical protein
MTNMKFSLVLMVLLTTTASAQEDRSWHFLSQTYGGTISLLKDLTKHECDFLYARAYHNPATDEEKAAAELLKQRQKEERDRYEAAHPECQSKTVDQIIKQPLTCTMRNTVQSYMITSGDIKSAECFQ